ncbi:GDP-mannose 4,6-dehydratase [Shimazuella sp. AN120528]|nr:GDP-mannose 4,6-dehydratase [Shimazuella soli]
MKLLITGGAGFIGSNLVQHLSLFTQYKKIGVIDNFDPFYPAEVKKKRIKKWEKIPSIQLYKADIRDESQMEEIFKAENWDTIIHLAAVPCARSSIEDPALYSDVNVTGTVQILQLAAEHQIKRFIFISSSSIYGSVDEPYPFHEEEIVSMPISPYATSKWAAENYCQLFYQLYGFDITVLRLFTTFGPGQRPDMAMHKFAEQMVAGIPVTIFDPASTRDYTYISDVVEAIRLSLEWTNGYQVYNVGSGISVNIMQMLDVLSNALGTKHEVKVLGEHDCEVKHTVADIRKLEQSIGFRPKVTFQEGILLFANWFLEEKRLK